ncbi:hypothetical protein G3I59_27300 [Amycolatopsis rubida]|uniref:Uncharacterized protein n=1 Tax=Amycolatopsis rubida TaxID=112413 RepID=A0ABX0BU97_9PSEU|nr:MULTISPECIES: hypothetical protein [Amycolatopsis]MYW94205.1 hypothetical protein [Amycolatopsis rubida]NEC59194.1 hypothetical protein [Amycolatopsis rubida]OAP20863.1 hypothetical protein A4R44_08308 [Amycolatopsis sp. M39]
MKTAVSAGLETGDRKLRESRLTLGAELLVGAWLVIAAVAFTSPATPGSGTPWHGELSRSEG